MRLWIRCLFPTITALTTLPLLAMASYGQVCTSDSLHQAVEQLQDEQKRPEAQKALKQCSTDAVKPLKSALTNPNPITRRYAAQTLGQLGQDSKSATQSLKVTTQEDEDTQVRHDALLALGEIAEAMRANSAQLQGWQTGDIQELKTLKEKMDGLLAALEKDKKDWPTKVTDLETLRLTRNRLQGDLTNLTDQPVFQVVSWGQSNFLVIGIVGFVVTAYGGTFWLRPLWLLKLGDEPIKAIASIPKVGTVLSGILKGLSPLKYHPRVLDAWVEQHWQQLEKAFLELGTVKDRQIHIPLPVRLGPDGKLINQLSGHDLNETFQKRPAVLLITGEGGVGKSSLAFQIAQWGLRKQLAAHRLLPVLVDTELDDKKTLIEAIRGQLNALINEQDDIPTDLLEKLLQRQRILVIVDHLSETGEATRKQVLPDLATFPAKALVITSRLDERLGGVPKTMLQPLRIEADRLLGFMQAYVRGRLDKPDDPFVDDEYAAACDRLRRMVGQRNITVLLARLYAEQMIEQQQGAGGMLPASVPELMLSYLNQLNRTIESANQRDRLQVQRDAQVIAWECLKETYRPTAARRESIIKALRETHPSEDRNAQEKSCSESLKYLEDRLRLIQTPDPGDHIRIVLDPLAEYLAANHLVDRSRGEENPDTFWKEFLDSIDPILGKTNAPLAAIQGFLLAVRDCCLVKQTEAQIPTGVPEALASKAGLDPEQLKQDEEKRRIRLLIAELSAPELEYRIEAAEKLSQRGAAAKTAKPNLIGMLENRNQPTSARQAAAQALGNLGIGADHLLTLLTDSADEPDLRRSAAEALGLMKTGQVELLQILESDNQPLPVRQGAARGLSLIGTPSGEPNPMLIIELEGKQVITQVKYIPVWKEVLTQRLSLDLVAISGGEFLMGSPVDEVGRDWYYSYYPDTEGLDVEAQHLVTVPTFTISKYPITQAQWEFIAALPRIECDLDPDQASFNGDNLPVEMVLWHEAMEFCARLSKHTGRIYRLPSEAEWEYACRAGTSKPFHLGDTLSMEFANYDSNSTYGTGIQGVYRQKTTDVGSLGIVNAFGLSDMHGSIMEWCLDHWHSSYQEAPTDGTAWLTNNEKARRILRGGAWPSVPINCRSASRLGYVPTYRYNYVGFRVVLTSMSDISANGVQGQI
jgi:formylglycine-generating enzyme required for sulfatase activity